jgi:hypothetical protein
MEQRVTCHFGSAAIQGTRRMFAKWTYGTQNLFVKFGGTAGTAKTYTWRKSLVNTFNVILFPVRLSASAHIPVSCRTIR